MGHRHRAETLLALALVWGLALLAGTVFGTYWVAIATATLMWTALCIAWNVTGGVLGQVSFGNSVFFGIGAYLPTWLETAHDVPPTLGLLAGVVASAAAGYAMGYIPFRWNLGRLTFALLTLACAYAFEFTFSAIPAMGGTNGLFLKAHATGFWDFGAHGRLWPAGILLVLVTAMLAAAHILLNRRIGYFWRATHQNEVAAAASGIDLFRVRQAALLFTAATTAIAGTIQSRYIGFIDPESVFGVGITLQILLFTVVGGSGTVIGPVIGPLLLVPLGEALRLWFGSDNAALQPAAFGALLIAVILLWPAGLAGLVRRLLPPETPPGPAGRAVPVIARVGRLIETTGLTKRFGGVRALDDVGFHVDAAEIVGVIGPNGAGKTTLFATIAGSHRPTAGNVFIAGRDGTGLPPYRINRLGVARTFQSAQIFPALAVRDVVLTAALAHAAPGLATARADAALADVGLADKSAALSRDLTLADQRRLEIARALATAPAVILLDEVMAGLTAREVAFVLDLIRRLSAAGIAVVLIEHNIRAVMTVSQRVVVLDAGRVIAAGPPAAVAADPRVIEAYLGTGETIPAVAGSEGPDPDAAALLAVEAIEAGYDGLTVLHGAGLTLAPGEAVALLGANGAGKSTMLRTISGLIRPVAGTIRLAGEDLLALPPEAIPRRGLVHVPETRHMFTRLTVRENLRIGGTPLGSSRARDTALEEVLALFPALRERLDTPAGTLSGGQQQMVAIGRALMARPKVIMLDEPSLGLAPIVVDEVYAAITRLVASGLAILLVEQDIHRALRLARRGYVLEHGRIVLSGLAEALLDDEKVRQSYLGT